jgi:hypothetical protein
MLDGQYCGKNNTEMSDTEGREAAILNKVVRNASRCKVTYKRWGRDIQEKKWQGLKASKCEGVWLVLEATKPV